MNGKAKWTVVSAALWVSALSCRAETPEIRVRLHVYAPVSAPALKRAREVASNVLLQAGVRLSWAQCSIREEEPTQDAACLERLWICNSA
jgi:hypothetical protein